MAEKAATENTPSRLPDPIEMLGRRGGGIIGLEKEEAVRYGRPKRNSYSGKKIPLALRRELR
jgi:hypothetical protein